MKRLCGAVCQLRKLRTHETKLHRGGWFRARVMLIGQRRAAPDSLPKGRVTTRRFCLQSAANQRKKSCIGVGGVRFSGDLIAHSPTPSSRALARAANRRSTRLPRQRSNRAIGRMINLGIA
jgi:hypothetical protein